jgi:thiamine kinase
VNSQLNAVEALAVVPGWDPETADIQELSGGLTNRVYHVRSSGQECVLRLHTHNNGSVHLDRSCELAILETAADAGIAPAILYADSDAGILVTEYLHGAPWQESDLESSENIEALAELLRHVHELPLCRSRVDLAAIAEKYEEQLHKYHGPHAFASNCVRIISESPVHESVACCHNDIVAANIVDSGALKLVDWEYARDNDPMFDLASVIGFHDFDKDRQLLLASCKDVSPNRFAPLMRFNGCGWPRVSWRRRTGTRHSVSKNCNNESANTKNRPLGSPPYFVNIAALLIAD